MTPLAPLRDPLLCSFYSHSVSLRVASAYSSPLCASAYSFCVAPSSPLYLLSSPCLLSSFDLLCWPRYSRVAFLHVLVCCLLRPQSLSPLPLPPPPLPPLPPPLLPPSLPPLLPPPHDALLQCAPHLLVLTAPVGPTIYQIRIPLSLSLSLPPPSLFSLLSFSPPLPTCCLRYSSISSTVLAGSSCPLSSSPPLSSSRSASLSDTTEVTGGQKKEERGRERGRERGGREGERERGEREGRGGRNSIEEEAKSKERK